MIRSISLTAALGLCACGGLTNVDSGPSLTDAARKVGRSYRVLAIEDDPSLTIVSFDDPANPQVIETPLPAMGYRAYDVEWSFNGQRLAATTTDKDIDYQVYFAFSSENWTKPEQLVRDPFASGIAKFRWLGDEQYLTIYYNRWSLASLSNSHPTTVQTMESDLFLWPGNEGYSYLIRDSKNYYWFYPRREPVEIRVDNLVWFESTRDGDPLLLVYTGESEPEASNYDNIWSMEAAPQAGCTPTEESGDCLPRFGRAERIPGTSNILIRAFSKGAEGAWQSIMIREHGQDVPISTNALDPGVIHAWGPDNTEQCFPRLVSDKIWIYCADGEDSVHLEQFEMTPSGPKSVYSTTLDPIASTFSSPAAIKSTIFGHVLSEDGSYPETWRMLDLQGDVDGWKPWWPIGELIMGLGESGAIFVDTPGDPEPFSPPCAPCSFTAVKDVLDPASPILTGTFNAPFAPAYPNLRETFWPAPDGSGVLTLEDGVLFYENFSAPGVRFPLTEVAESASIHLPPTWGN